LRIGGGIQFEVTIPRDGMLNPPLGRQNPRFDLGPFRCSRVQPPLDGEAFAICKVDQIQSGETVESSDFTAKLVVRAEPVKASRLVQSGKATVLVVLT